MKHLLDSFDEHIITQGENTMFKVTIFRNEGQEKWSCNFDSFEKADAAAEELASSKAWENHTIIVQDMSNGRELARYENLKYTKEELDISIEEHVDKNLLTKNDYEQCLNSQSACNVTGLIYYMNDLRERLWNTARQSGKGTEWINHHPILQLYAYQLAHLVHGREPIEWEGYSDAYKYCKEVVAGNIKPDADWTHSIFTCYHK